MPERIVFFDRSYDVASYCVLSSVFFSTLPVDGFSGHGFAAGGAENNRWLSVQLYLPFREWDYFTFTGPLAPRWRIGPRSYLGRSITATSLETLPSRKQQLCTCCMLHVLHEVSVHFLSGLCRSMTWRNKLSLRALNARTQLLVLIFFLDSA